MILAQPNFNFEVGNLYRLVTHLWGCYSWVSRVHPIAELKDVYWQKKSASTWFFLNLNHDFWQLPISMICVAYVELCYWRDKCVNIQTWKNMQICQQHQKVQILTCVNFLIRSNICINCVNLYTNWLQLKTWPKREENYQTCSFRICEDGIAECQIVLTW